MEKFLLSFLMSLLLLLPARVSATPTEVSFASGVPSDWTKSGTCAVQNSGTYKGSTQLQTNAYVQSPAITGINSLKIKLTRSGGGTDFTISYSYDKSEWNELAKYTSSTVNSGGTFQEQEIPSSAISAIDASKPVYLKFHSTKASYFISTITYEIGGGGGDVLAAPTFTVNGTAVSGTTATVYAGDKVEAACSTSGATVTLQLNNSAVSNPYTITEAAGTVLNFEAVAEKAGAEPTSTSANLTVTVAKTPVITDALTDEIIFSNFLTSAGKPVSGGNTTYGDYSFTSSITGITYKANMATGNNSIQLRSKNSNSGIVTTENPKGYTLSSIEIEWNSNTAKNNILKILGDNSKYTAATDLYATSSNNYQAKGEELGSITNGTSTCTLSDLTKTFIGLRSSDGALYINKITLKWVKATQKEPTKVTLGWSTDYTDNTMDLYLGQKMPVTAEARKADNVKCEDANIIYSSADPTIVSVSNNELTPADNTAAGKTTTITASLKEGDDYVYADGAGDITLTVNVKKSDVTLSKVAGVSTDMTVNGTTSIDELVGVSIHGNQEVLNPAKAALTCVVTNGADLVEIKGDLITAKKAGEVTLMFAVPEAEKYNASNELEVNLTINKLAAGIKYDTDEVIGYLHEASDELPVLSNPNALDVTYTSKDPYVASVDKNGNVTIRHIGTTIITASFNGNDVYTADEVMYMLDVKLKADPSEGGPVVYEPAVYDEYGNLLIGDNYQIDNVIVQTDFITIEHEPGAKIYYRYTNKGEQGTNRPMMAQGDFTDATSETSDYHTVVTNDETTNTRVKYYPYGKPGTYDRWNNGELELYAEKDGVQSDHRTIAFDTPTSVEGIEAEGNGEVEYFNLQGVKVQNPEKGIYIRVQDGKAVKIVK